MSASPNNELSVAHFAREMAQFATDRDWNQFNDPKSLMLALTGEVGELAECFQWLNPQQAPQLVQQEPLATAVKDEVADVFLYLLQLCNQCGIDLAAATTEKIRKNAKKYPVEASRKAAKKAATSGQGITDRKLYQPQAH